MRMVIISMVAVVGLFLPEVVTAAVPLQLPLQGVLRDNAGVPVVEDVFEVTFSLYDASDATEPVWTETWPPDGVTCLDDPGACVHVQGGRFQVALGTHTALDLSLVSSADGLWLGMKVETDPELPRRPLGSTPYALHASSSDSAGTASGLDCTGCIEPDALSNDTVLDLLDTTLLAVQNAGYVHEGDLAAGAVPFDDATTELGADTVQGAIENLKGLIAEQGGGSGDVNEGAGQVIVYEQDTAVAAYGSTKRYVHLINPSTPKVVAHVYGDQASDIGGSGNLVVAYDFMPNEYSGGALANAGETAIQVSNPSLFNAGTHVLIHQTVGGDGAVAGTWENAQVVAVNGTTLQLVQPLQNAYLTNDTAKAQVVTAASFGHLEIVSGGTLRPSLPLQPDGSRGGIVYIRSNKVSVKSGGIIDADGMGFAGGAKGFPRHQGASECAPGLPGSGQDNSCSGGGAGDWTCGGSGGGGNYTPGDDGTSNGACNGGGSGGEVKGTGTPTPLEFGGGGGGAAVGSGGAGGGIVVLGAQTLIISEGGQIRSNGQPGSVAGAGGGAGGTVAIFADQVQADHEGATEALGGLGNTDEARGQAGPGAGWSFVANPSNNKSMNMDTHSHGGGYSPYHDEFWYPGWSGTTVYRHNKNGNEFSNFSSGQSDIMQLWGDVDGSYYTANWSRDRIYRWKSLEQPTTELWNFHMGSTAGGVCTDGAYVYAVRNSGSQIWKLERETGALVDQFDRSGGSDGIHGGLVCLPGRLIYAHSCSHAYVYDSSTGQQIHDFGLNECPYNTSFDGQTMWISSNDSSVRGYDLTTANIYTDKGHGGDGGEGWNYETTPIPGIVNESFPKGVRLLVDGNDVTAAVGDPNGKGPGSYDPNHGWGATGLQAWSTGPLDVTNVANWTLGEHLLELKETGGAGGQLKSYVYVIYPFTESTPPVNDNCTSPVALDPNGQEVVISGTTEDTMGKTLATDASDQAGCGGQGGPDVVYRIDLAQRSLLHAVAVAPFPTRLYIRADSCVSGSMVYCADKELTTNPIDPGTYFLWVDSNAPIAKGDFSLAVSTTPALLPVNDTCADAEELFFDETGSVQVQSSSIYALDQLQGYCSTQSGGPDVMYKFTLDEGKLLDVQVQADFDPVVVLMKDGCGADFQFNCQPTGALNQFVPAGTYWLAVDGAGEKVWGDYTLTVTLQ